MKNRTADNITAFLAGLALFALVFIATDANATKKPPEPPKMTVEQQQGQAQGQGQDQSQTLTGTQETTATGTATASNDGVTVEGDSLEISEQSNVENNSSTVVLVPNNNTENCLRVFGLAFGQDGSSGALGVPWRSKACDYGKAADAAAAYGNHDLAWYWRCHKKNLYKDFISRGPETSRDEERVAAIEKCHTKMAGENANLRTIALLNDQLEAANARADLAKRHEGVCKESKERCEDKLYGGK